MMRCDNQKTRMDYFTTNMNTLGVPWQKSEVLTIVGVIVLVEQILKTIDDIGGKTTVRELAFAGNLFEKVKVLKAMSLAGMAGIIIGSLAQSEYEYQTCGGSPLLDLIDFAQRQNWYRGYLRHVWNVYPAIYNKNMPARILTASRMGNINEQN